MQKTCSRESYALYPRKNPVLNLELFFGFQSKTNQKINTLKSSILKIENVRHDYALQEHNQSTVSYIKIHWKLALCILLYPILHAFNLLLCLLKAIKEIAISCIMIIAVFHSLCLSAQTPRKDSGVNGQKHEIEGAVVSSTDGRPLVGVSVYVEAEYKRVSTKKDGTFQLTVGARKGKVRFTHVGYKTVEMDYTDGILLNVAMIPSENQLEEVQVVSTGYQSIPKERATGSFEFVDNKLLNRKVSMDFLSRLEDVVTGLSATKVYDENRGKLPNINVRGQSSIRSNIWPLIVVDGFPYSGDFNNINPNDIENVTVLKDAAASSIWGAQSGNGIIVVTTKKAKYNEPLTVSVNTNLTVENKPDLNYFPQMSSSDFIDFELFLNQKGHYNYRMDDYSFMMTPVVQLLKKFRDGKITETEMNKEINGLRKLDIRNDFSKYIYRKPVKQQYNIQIAGGGSKLNSVFSIGYDKQLNKLVTSSSDRISVRNMTIFRPFEKLELNLGTQYTEYTTKDSYLPVQFNEMLVNNYPYAQLADRDGRAMNLGAYGMNSDFTDTLARERLLEWNYRPLDELYESSSNVASKETMLSFGANYTVIPDLKISFLYNYRNSNSSWEMWRGIGTAMQRTMINFYTSWQGNGPTVNHVPIGDYLLSNNRNSSAHQGRVQAVYDKIFKEKHQLNVLVGAEVRQQIERVNSNTLYGYEPETMTFQPVDLISYHPYLNGMYGVKRVDNYDEKGEMTNRYTSFFINGAYTYDKRYILSGSARKDASNLFGVKTNDKGQPFWSLGGAWVLSEESFMDKDLFPYLKLRMTYGYNGNVNNTTSAFPVMFKSTQPHFMTGLPYASMQNPPNPNLRWERVGMLNLGLDFRLKNDRFGGSAEYYIKSSKDLILGTRVDPTSGFTSLNINGADLKGKGVDLTLYTVNVKIPAVEWRTDMNLAYSRTRVTRSYIAEPKGKYYRSGAYSLIETPIEGSDVRAVISYDWAVLDPQTGAPRGYLNGEISSDYRKIINDTQIQDMKNSGSAMPLYFGSVRNTFKIQNFDFSFNISLQLGHKFVRKSINYDNMVYGGPGHSDYSKRWQQPGDEQHTDVPAFNFPANYYADEFYTFSSALVAPADQIKWRDFQIGYTMKTKFLKELRMYAYGSNIMTIWRANKLGIDPEFGNNPPDPFAGSIGVSFKF